MTSIEKVQTILYNGQETNYLILTVEAAKKHLECDIGYEAQLNKKEYVALEEDSGTYTWYGFNDESNWKNLAMPANIEEQITEQDAEYLLLHGALKSK